MKKLGRELIYKNIKEKNHKLNACLFVAEEKSKSDGLLSGVFMGVKDNIQVAGMPLTNGSKFFENYTSPYTATVVDRLQKAGVSVCAKLNMDEFAMGSANLYSAYGEVKNPWDLERVPGGSSGGSAAAVAALMCDFALGSDTGGSVRQPAAYCGVYGYKPTYGVLSRFGLTAFASSLDQIGILSRSADDIIEIMSVAAGKDVNDSTSIDAPLFKFEDISLKNKKIGIIKEYLTLMKNSVKTHYERFTSYLKDKGAEIIELSFPEYKKVISVYQIISTAEASSNLARFDGIRYTKRADSDSIKGTYIESRSNYFGEEVKRRILLGSFVLSSECYDSYYLKASKVRTVIFERWNKFFELCDFILTPTTADIPFKINEKPDPITMYSEDLFTIAANLTGMPAISFPAGTSSKLPVGLQLIGAEKSDSALLNMVRVFEKEFCNFETIKKEIENV